MPLGSKLVNGNMVYYDTDYPNRWVDAIGPEVVKWSFGSKDVISTTSAVGHTVTQTNGTLVPLASTSGGAVTFTLGGADNDLAQVQLKDEPFYFAAAWPAYFGAKFELVDFDQTDFFAGLTITDTDLDGGVTDGLYFRTVDEAGVLQLVFEKNNVEALTTLVTGADATAYTVEWFYGGADDAFVYTYLDGALIAKIAASSASFPNDEHLAPVLCVKAGEATANNAVIYWARAFQVQHL